jgi:hypothetical protein
MVERDFEACSRGQPHNSLGHRSEQIRMSRAASPRRRHPVIHKVAWQSPQKRVETPTRREDIRQSVQPLVEKPPKHGRQYRRHSREAKQRCRKARSTSNAMRTMVPSPEPMLPGRIVAELHQDTDFNGAP